MYGTMFAFPCVAEKGYLDTRIKVVPAKPLIIWVLKWSMK